MLGPFMLQHFLGVDCLSKKKKSVANVMEIVLVVLGSLRFGVNSSDERVSLLVSPRKNGVRRWFGSSCS